MVLTKDIQVVVLMGGLGTRLHKELKGKPKAMIDVSGKPFFHYQLKLLRWYGFCNFVFCVGHKGALIKKYFGTGKRFGVSIKYSDEGDRLLGTGGALRKAASLLKDNFLLIYGDSYMDFDYSQLVYFYNKMMFKAKAGGILVVLKNNNRFDRSNVVLLNNRVIKYDKVNWLPSMKYIDYGVSILKKDQISSLPKDRPIDLASVYKKISSQGRLLGFETKKRFYEIGRPYSLNGFRKFAENTFLKKKPYIFLDRDGVLNQLVKRQGKEMVDSPFSVSELKFAEKATVALRIIRSLGYGLIVVTNQPAAAKGKTSLDNIYAINNEMQDYFGKSGIYFDDFLTCIHHPEGSHLTVEKWLIMDCECRKPKPGMLNKSFEKFNVDKKHSYMVGDSYTDIILGKRAGLKSVFVGKYKCESCRLLKGYRPDIIVDNIFDFAQQLKKKRN